MSKPSLSVIIPCYNEEGNVAKTVDDLMLAMRDLIEDYEIFIFDDCSQDKTWEVAKALAEKNLRVKAIHNEINMGVGYNFYRGIEMATKDYVVTVFGDNEVTRDSIREIFRQLGNTDLILPYIENTHVRPLHRRFFSVSYTFIINTICGQDVRYYNGPVVFRRKLIQKVVTRNDGFGYMSQIVSKLLKLGCTYCEVPFVMQPRSYGQSTALKPKNFVSVARTIWLIALDQVRKDKE